LTPPGAVSIVRRCMGEFRQTHSTLVAGSLDDCFAVLTDFAAYPAWSGPVTECRVLDRHPDGLPRRVAFALDFTLKTIRYILEYTYEPPHRARWRLVEGDVTDVQGSYEFRVRDGAVEATCTQEIDIGFWIPGPLRRTFEAKALRDSVEDFRKAVETRRAAGPTRS
jgi:Polyketide cyclase / dehydrase and lipid transport